MLSDLRYAIRILRQSPGFALTSIVSIALGIGANSAIFSLADGLLLRPLPVANPSQIVTVRSRTPGGAFGEMSYPDFADIRDHNRSFDGLAAWQVAPCGIAMNSGMQSQLRFGFQVSGNFFRVLGVNPQIGRGFNLEEDRVPGRDAVVVLGNDFWMSEFAGKAAAVGRHIQINGVDFTIIGVVPKSFTGMDQFIRPAFFIPAMMGPRIYSRDLLTGREDRGWLVKGRLKPGISLQAADTEIAGLAKSLEQSFPATNRGYGTALRSELQTRLDKGPGNAVTLGLLFPAVIVALLIACANVANLTLGRGRARAREVAVRLAIGASRGRLVRQFMAESLVIALAGGGLGLLVAQLGIDAFSNARIPSDIPIQLNFQMDQRVLWFTILTACACAVLFGMLPALQSTRADVAPALKAGDQDQRNRWLGRSALATAQIAGSFVLLAAASQLFRGFSTVVSQGPGFRPDHLTMMSVDPTLIRYTPAQMEQLYKAMSDRARSLPGVKSAALSYSIPLGTDQQEYEEVLPEGFQFRPGQSSLNVQANTVDPYYFETFGVPILRGRAFSSNDRTDSPHVAIVNETMARRYFGGGKAIGKRFRLRDKNGPWVEIVGVAAAGKYSSLFEPPTDFLYLPLSQNPQLHMTLIAASFDDPALLAQPLRTMVHSIDPELPVFGVRTVDNFFRQGSVALLRRLETIVGSASLLALVLALIGLYAVVAYEVGRRTREIGIRIAVGADARQVAQMIIREAGRMGVTGTVIGVMLSLAAGRVLRAAAVEMPSFDVMLFVLVTIGLLLVTFLAVAIPARRAATIDPVQALRQE